MNDIMHETYNVFKQGKASVLIDGQFGSTGKGLAAAFQWQQADQHGAVDWRKFISVTNAAPNAGHTTVLPNGRKFVTYHMPTVGVLAKESTIYLDAGAIIDPDLLEREMKDLGVNPDRVVIHPHAGVITESDRIHERSRTSGATAIASTQKGVGAALARKIMREPPVAKNVAGRLQSMGVAIADMDLESHLSGGHTILIEVPQGMSLSLNHGFYPHCTSREVSVSQALSDAGLHPRWLGRTLMTLRTFPIRVGHIYDGEGNVIGHSGGVFDDQRELSWNLDLPHIEPERTTVTKRVRRIFTFSCEQYELALRRLRPDIVHLGFCDYLKDRAAFTEFVVNMKDVSIDAGIDPAVSYAFGPSTADIELFYGDAVRRFK